MPDEVRAEHKAWSGLGIARPVRISASSVPRHSNWAFRGCMKKFLHNVAERIKSMRQGRRDTEYQIECDGGEVCVNWLTMENSKGSVAFSWDKVRAVDTFKRDLFSVDCICLAFETADGWIEVNEDMKGWRDFLGVVESSLKEFPPRSSWYNKVMLPPFATNHSRLWERKPGAQIRGSE